MDFEKSHVRLGGNTKGVQLNFKKSHQVRREEMKGKKKSSKLCRIINGRPQMIFFFSFLHLNCNDDTLIVLIIRR